MVIENSITAGSPAIPDPKDKDTKNIEDIASKIVELYARLRSATPAEIAGISQQLSGLLSQARNMSGGTAAIERIADTTRATVASTEFSQQTQPNLERQANARQQEGLFGTVSEAPDSMDILDKMAKAVSNLLPNIPEKSKDSATRKQEKNSIRQENRSLAVTKASNVVSERFKEKYGEMALKNNTAIAEKVNLLDSFLGPQIEAQMAEDRRQAQLKSGDDYIATQSAEVQEARINKQNERVEAKIANAAAVEEAVSVGNLFGDDEDAFEDSPSPTRTTLEADKGSTKLPLIVVDLSLEEKKRQEDESPNVAVASVVKPEHTSPNSKTVHESAKRDAESIKYVSPLRIDNSRSAAP